MNRFAFNKQSFYLDKDLYPDLFAIIDRIYKAGETNYLCLTMLANDGAIDLSTSFKEIFVLTKPCFKEFEEDVANIINRSSILGWYKNMKDAKQWKGSKLYTRMKTLRILDSSIDNFIPELKAYYDELIANYGYLDSYFYIANAIEIDSILHTYDVSKNDDSYVISIYLAFPESEDVPISDRKLKEWGEKMYSIYPTVVSENDVRLERFWVMIQERLTNADRRTERSEKRKLFENYLAKASKMVKGS